MSDQDRKSHFSSGFSGLDEAGKTHIEKMLSQFLEPSSPEPSPPNNQEPPTLCKTPENELQ
jgi:hypothetical protein